jgi:hypothetical protein
MIVSFFSPTFEFKDEIVGFYGIFTELVDIYPRGTLA